MELVKVKSSNIQAIGYDRKTKTLRIQFVEGSSYDYAAVPASLHGSLMAAESKGSFFQDNVVGQFKYTKESNQMKKANEAATKTTTPVQPAAQPKQEAPKPAATAQPTAQPTKQEVTLLKLTVALREQRKIEVKPEMLKQDGKFILLVVGPAWPTIRIGNSGGITVMELRSYADAFKAAVDGDTLYEKQKARDAKKAAAPAPQPAPAKAETPTQKKAKADKVIEQQLATA